jgi:hypothetical protein
MNIIQKLQSILRNLLKQFVLLHLPKNQRTLHVDVTSLLHQDETVCIQPMKRTLIL